MILYYSILLINIVECPLSQLDNKQDNLRGHPTSTEHGGGRTRNQLYSVSDTLVLRQPRDIIEGGSDRRIKV